MNNNTTPRYDSHIAKKTYTEKAASLVQNSAARWRAIQKHLRNNNQRSSKEEIYTKENTTRLRQRKRNPTQIYETISQIFKNLTSI